MREDPSEVVKKRSSAVAKSDSIKSPTFDDTDALGPFDLDFLDGFRWCNLDLQPFSADREKKSL
ncbi:MAG: hypothetical protein KC800_31350 [Candidatus Eremiobacteraeota bacterium]|nr:hypothetical protein [Candidatus Eremiobacteraeota bacterium]